MDTATSLDTATPQIPLALYLHFPWCVRKCPYCDFNSHPFRGDIPEDAYIDALLRDLDFELRDAPAAPPLTSIFCGGGTPSLFSGRAIGRLFEQLACRLHFAPEVEITLEANPGTADTANFRAYRDAGVNRLSIGVQSFADRQLQRLGRIHGRAQALTAFAAARDAGFDNINLDLMFALPQQTLAEALADLETACALEPEHLSYYQLTIEPNTEFAARPPVLPDDEAAWTIQCAAQQRLAARGWRQYEVSAYARAGRECRHNRNYWEFGDYLGLGAGAHGKRTGADGVRRRARRKHPQAYLAGAGTAECLLEDRLVSAADLPYEFAMNALRLYAGFPAALFRARTGLAESSLQAPLANAQARKLVDSAAANGTIRASALGWAHLNTLIALFI